MASFFTSRKRLARILSRSGLLICDGGAPPASAAEFVARLH